MRSPYHYGHLVDKSNWMIVDVADMPTESAHSRGFTAEVKAISDSADSAHSCHGKIKLYVEKPNDIAVGDRLLVLASADRPSPADNPHQFDYRRHLARKGILFTDYVPATNWRLLKHNERGLLPSIYRLRLRLADVISSSRLSSSQQAVAEALILGWDDDLDDATRDNFRHSGVVHILCVSGLHVGIVALIIGWLLAPLGNRRGIRVTKGIVQISAIWFFVMLTGMAPGTVRAGIMFTVISVGDNFFNRPSTLNAIATSALIMLVARPLVLFDVGFQLSYCSVLGIVALVPPIKRFFPVPQSKNRLVAPCLPIYDKLLSLFIVSLVAQMCVAPFTLYYFHEFPVYFLVANMVVVPFAGVLVGGSLLLVVLSWWPVAFHVVGTGLSWLIYAIQQVTSAIASWPHSVVTGIYFDDVMFALSLCVALLLAVAVLRRDLKPLAAALSVAIAMTVYARGVERRCGAQCDFTVYRAGRHTAIEFFYAHSSYLLCDSATAQYPDDIDFQTANNLIYRQATRKHTIDYHSSFNDSVLVVDNHFVGFDGMIIKIIDRDNCRQRPARVPHIDYLLLCGNPYADIAQLKELYGFDTLLIASSNSSRRQEGWIRQCAINNIPYRK